VADCHVHRPQHRVSVACHCHEVVRSAGTTSGGAGAAAALLCETSADTRLATRYHPGVTDRTGSLRFLWSRNFPPNRLSKRFGTKRAELQICQINPISRLHTINCSFRISVPVLSTQRTSMLAASSTAESRVGRTPKCARARAAERRRKGKGGRQRYWDRRQNCGEHQGNNLTKRKLERVGVPHQQHDYNAIEHGEIAHHTQNFCWELSTCAVRTSSAVRPNFVCVPVAVTSATASPRRTNAPANVCRPGLASMGIDSPVSMDWSSKISPSIRRTSVATTAPSDNFTISQAPVPQRARLPKHYRDGPTHSARAATLMRQESPERALPGNTREQR
jgi:hypothetical protein